MSRIKELEKQITELDERKVALQKELELEKWRTEIEYPPLNFKEKYYFINDEGEVYLCSWCNDGFDKRRCKMSNVFITKEAAEKERDRRILLTRFRQFRDKCNGDWKPDFESWEVNKYYVAYSYVSNALCCLTALLNTDFQPFGYFKNRTDCERAIELFGDEIKRLFVEE
ncbi:hypothetical protein [uncultured Granulicatella sp.]|uniref:hypothetical protein n=1 Tax=uncultured Granulicatella sp. TaxID=316089 RepID=UPI0028D5657B|nr:hypothetical protein [uncultured Granulicatella sp.]